MKSDKVILDLCGGTGAWSKPYKEAGYNVYNISLPDWDVRKTLFYRDEYLIFKFQQKEFFGDLNIPIESIYGILAAPPCTMFSLARTTAKNKSYNYRDSMEIVIACLEIIWECQYKIKEGTKRKPTLKFWALENPVGMLRYFLGRPNFTFQPWWYGDLWTKRTDIWGFFNSPPKKFKWYEVGLLVEKRWEKKFSGTRKSSERAITPPGFAKAFFEANR